MITRVARLLIKQVFAVPCLMRRLASWRVGIAAIMLFALSGVAEASTTCSANVTLTGTGSGNAQTFDVFQSGNCDNDALGLFAGTNVPITNDAVGSSGPQTVTGSKGNTYTLEWSGPNPDTYTMILVSQVASGPETLTYSYFYDDGSADPGNTTNAIFTVNVTLPSLGPTVPGAPTIGTATRGNAQASITFTAPASNGGAAITSFTATSSPGGFTGTNTASPIIVTGLTNGTAYTFTVTATNGVGTGSASAASNSVTPATVPGPPTIGTATGGNGQATIRFIAPTSNGGSAITGYTVTSSPGGITATGTSSPITITGLTNGTAYTFTVAATNGVGTGTPSSSSNSVTPATVPGSPSIGTATGGNGQASVAFTAPASNGGSAITSYTATSSPGGFTGSGTSSPIAVSGLTNGTAYTFTVTATNGIGTGSPSPASNVVTPSTVPGAPTIGTATASSGQAAVSFTAPASNGGSAITGYTVTSSPGGITAAGTSSPITVTGLTNGTAYTFSVTATNGTGTSIPSAASNSVTPDTVPTLTAISPAAGPIAGGTSVTLTGTAFIAGNTSVSIGGVTIPAASVTVNSSSSLTFSTPAHAAGSVAVTVTTQIGTSSAVPGGFAYSNAPTVTSISPTAGPAIGGTQVIISGSSFTSVTAVKFGTVNATAFTVTSGTSITATAPAGTGTVDITVTAAGGTTATSAADQFTYFGAPTVTALSPVSGSANGGTSVTITGTNFFSVSAVKFGTAGATMFTVNSTTSITATSPAGLGAVDITVTTASGTSATSAADRFSYQAATTNVALSSSANPSTFGQAVTFTATVSGSGATPGGTVTFSDGGVVLGAVALSSGIATLTTSALKSGVHSITAAYGGSANFAAGTSPAFSQTVNIPADSVKLHQLQANVTPMVAQASGQAISGAIDTAITEGFSDDGAFASPSPTGFHLNFAADPYEEHTASDDSAAPGGMRNGPFGGAVNGYGPSDGASNGPNRQSGRRIDDAFAAIDKQMPTKAKPKKFREEKDWLFWVDVRGSGIDRLTTTTTVAGISTTNAASLYGYQINALMGVTRKLTPDFLVGAFAGYETFNFTEQDINGKLTGDGWTVGSYLGWRITPSIRYDLAAAYSGINYDGVAGTAQGNFTGHRWLLSSGFTGTYKAWGLMFEPSAKVYALWENEGSYIDSLGTFQPNHDFATGRASVGAKASYLYAWSDTVSLVPYVGLYSDYYFNQDNSSQLLNTGAVQLASTPLLDGWSARLTAGLGAKLASGPIISAGAEYGGIGSNFQIWTFKGKAQVPF